MWYKYTKNASPIFSLNHAILKNNARLTNGSTRKIIDETIAQAAQVSSNTSNRREEVKTARSYKKERKKNGKEKKEEITGNNQL